MKTTKQVYFELNTEIYLALKEVARSERTPVSEVIRRILTDAVARMSAVGGLQEIEEVVRQEVRLALRDTQKRIANLLRKATRAARTNTYLSAQCIMQAKKHYAAEMDSIAEVKAVDYLKACEEDE
jgi:hypothetical protein